MVRNQSQPLIFDADIFTGIRERFNVRHSVCSSSDGLVASLAVPDTNRVSLDSGLSAEGADVSGVLGDFHLLDLLSERGTVSIWVNPLATRCDAKTRWPAAQIPPRCCSRSPAEVVVDADFYPAQRSPSTRIDAPDGCSTYLVPYLPVTPTFLVLFVIFAVVAEMNGSGDGGSWALFRDPF